MGWQAFQAGCYKLTSEKIDWDTAQKTCQKMEASLVSIHTLPELEFIIRNLKKGELLLLFHSLFNLNCTPHKRLDKKLTFSHIFLGKKLSFSGRDALIYR